MSAAPPISLILTLGDGDHIETLVLMEPGRSPVLGRLDPDALGAAEAALPALLAPQGGILIPGDDGVAARNEREAALLLSALITTGTSRALGDRLHVVTGRAGAEGRDVQLFIDARSQRLQRLPWELLEALPPGSAGAGFTVARLIGGEPRIPPNKPGVEVLLWLPEPEDKACQWVDAGLRQTLAALPSIQVTAIESAEPRGHGLRILHIISHGLNHLDAVTVRSGEGRSVAADSLARWLGAILPTVSLVYLDVCGGASGQVDSLDSPAWRLVSGGVPAAIAPQGVLATDASVAFSRGFYRDLTDAGTLIGAVTAGRRAVSGLGLSHPTCRWWNPTLVAANPDIANLSTRGGVSTSLAGLASPSAEAHPVLQEALLLAGHQGFLGVEHILLSLSQNLPEAQVIPGLRSRLETLAEPLLHLQSQAAQELHLTPRLRGLLGGLEEGFTLHDLLSLCLEIPWVRASLPTPLLLQVIGPGGATGHTTLSLDKASLLASLQAYAQPGVTLEVEGGPEDGRQLTLLRGGTLLGRWDPERGDERCVQLFNGGLVMDRSVSRRHLRYLGQGRVEPQAETRLLRGMAQSPTPMRGPMDLNIGDVIILGLGTRLRVLSLGEDEADEADEAEGDGGPSSV